MKKLFISFLLILLACKSSAALLDTKTLLNYCGYAILSINNPEMKFTKAQIEKITICHYYIDGVTDAIDTQRVLSNHDSKTSNKCYKNWLQSRSSSNDLVKMTYLYLTNNPKVLTVRPDIAILAAYDATFPRKDC